MREGDLDARLVQVQLDQTVVGTAHRPLVAGGGLDAYPDVDRAVGQGDDTGHLEGFEDLGLEVLVGGQFVEGVAQGDDRLVHVLAVGDAVFAHMVAEATHVVGDHIDAGEWHQMVGAVQVTDTHRADAELLGGAGDAAQGHHVAGIHGVFHLDEDTGDDVLHQLLGAETDGQTEHTGTGDQRSDVDADFRQHDHRRHGDDGDGQGIAEQRQQRLGPGRGHAAAGGRIQLVFDQAGKADPDRRGDDQDDGHVDHLADQHATRFGGVPGGHVEHAPGVEQGHGGDDQDQHVEGAQHRRDIGVEACLEQRQLLAQLTGQGDATTDGLGQQARHQHGSQHDTEGLEGRDQHERQGVLGACQGQHQHHGEVGDRQKMPDAAEQAQRDTGGRQAGPDSGIEQPIAQAAAIDQHHGDGVQVGADHDQGADALTDTVRQVGVDQRDHHHQAVAGEANQPGDPAIPVGRAGRGDGQETQALVA